MPKKTRQDKILAKLRRLESTQPTEKTDALQPQSKISVNLDSTFSNNENKSLTNQSTKAQFDYSYVVVDLKKTVFFVVVAVIFEVSLSLVIRNWL
jgi:hypothetical protein